MTIWEYDTLSTMSQLYKNIHIESGQMILRQTMYKVWIMGWKQYSKWKFYKIYVSHRLKTRLKMVEHEQNLKKNTGKGT